MNIVAGEKEKMMDTKSMIVEIVVIAMVISLPFAVLALSYGGKKLKENNHNQNLLSQIGMVFLKSVEIMVLFLAKVLSLLLTGEWSYVNDIVSSTKHREDDNI